MNSYLGTEETITL